MRTQKINRAKFVFFMLLYSPVHAVEEGFDLYSLDIAMPNADLSR